MENQEFHPVSDTAYPLRSPSVHVHTISDEAVLARNDGGELFAVNATALAVWELCDGMMAVGGLIEHLSHRYEAESEDIEQGVRTILADFHAKGLLTLQPSAAAIPSATHYLSFFDHHVEIYIDAPRLASSFEYSMEAALGDGSGTAVGRVEAYAHEEGFLVRDDRGREEVFDRRSGALTCMKRHFVTCLMMARQDLLWLHAGAVAKNGRAVLCAGQRGCGKSTLIAALYREGWSFFSDDVLPYDPETRCVLPFPLTPVFRNATPDPVAIEHLDRLTKSHLRLEPERIAVTPTPIDVIVFPTFQPVSPGPLAERAPAATVVQLAKHCFNLRGYNGDPMAALLQLASRARALDLEHNTDHSAIEQLRPVLSR